MSICLFGGVSTFGILVGALADRNPSFEPVLIGRRRSRFWCPNSVHLRYKFTQIGTNWWGKKIKWKVYLESVFGFWTCFWDLPSLDFKSTASAGWRTP